MHAGFRYPITLSGIGQAFSAIAAFVVCHVLRLVPAEKPVSLHFFATRMLPVGFFMALTLMLGNTVYMFLSVAFIQMLKAFTPVITMLGLFLAALEVREQSTRQCMLFHLLRKTPFFHVALPEADVVSVRASCAH